MVSQLAAERQMARARAAEDDVLYGYTRTEGPFAGKVREGMLKPGQRVMSFDEYKQMMADLKAREKAAWDALPEK